MPRRIVGSMIACQEKGIRGAALSPRRAQLASASCWARGWLSVGLCPGTSCCAAREPTCAYAYMAQRWTPEPCLTELQLEMACSWWLTEHGLSHVAFVQVAGNCRSSLRHLAMRCSLTARYHRRSHRN